LSGLKKKLVDPASFMSASAAIADVPLTRDVCVVDAVFLVYSVYLVAGVSRIEQTR
jgi:hypothetical protein